MSNLLRFEIIQFNFDHSMVFLFMYIGSILYNFLLNCILAHKQFKQQNQSEKAINNFIPCQTPNYIIWFNCQHIISVTIKQRTNT